MSAPGPATAPILVINAGSSSLKYQAVLPENGHALAAGLIERIGLPDSRVRHTSGSTTVERVLPLPDHATAFTALRQMLDEHGPDLSEHPPLAVGHRVVHGGEAFRAPALIDADVMAVLRELIPLAPLHNPGNILGIERAAKAFPDLPQVAVFDTAFHQSLPPEAYTYAVPRAWREQYGVRRYGFHGTSHSYVSRRVADLLGRPLEQVNSIVLHLGNGASACAVRGGASADTSMGMTPLDGLVMGTRPGDLDPGLGGHLARVAGLDTERYEKALSTESGLLGLAGTSDFRELLTARDAGDADAGLAFDVVVHRLVRHIGAAALVLGSVDAVAFTGGIGEHSPALRAAVLRRCGLLGCHLDEDANVAASGETVISTPGSAVTALVVPTNEEWEIARQSAAVIAEHQPPSPGR